MNCAILEPDLDILAGKAAAEAVPNQLLQSY